ncbi:hypothetical protein ACGLHS_12745 [Variovorax sp. VaC1]|uniref:hypothetical protein n=1 Tax=Variovorax sp. VaC1 TaxID=3373132 RepID=UPI003748CB12
MHSKLNTAAAMLLLSLAASGANAYRPDPFPQDFQPSRPVYRTERQEAPRDKKGTTGGRTRARAVAGADAGAAWGAGAGAGWGTGAAAGMSPTGWRRHSLERYDGYRYSSRDADGDGMPDHWDRHPQDPRRQ